MWKEKQKAYICLTIHNYYSHNAEHRFVCIQNACQHLLFTVYQMFPPLGNYNFCFELRSNLFFSPQFLIMTFLTTRHRRNTSRVLIKDFLFVYNPLLHIHKRSSTSQITWSVDMHVWRR